MNIKYYRDGGRIFMVIKTGGTNDNNYQYRMICKNRMQKILDSSLRVLDGEQYQYVDISGYVNLENRFSSHAMDGTEIRRLFTDMKQAMQELECYLLNPDGLLLAPEGILWSIAEQEYRFVFCVEHNNAREGRELFEWMSTHVTPADREAADMIYRALAMAQEKTASVGEILRKVLPKEPAKEEARCEKNRNERMNRTVDRGERAVPTDTDLGLFDDEYEDIDFTPAHPVYGSEEDEETGQGKLRYIIMAVLFALTGAVMVYIRLHYDMTLRENLLSGAVTVVSVAMTILSARSLLPERKEKREKSRFRKKRNLPEPEESVSMHCDADRIYNDIALAAKKEESLQFVELNPSEKGETERFVEDTETVLLQEAPESTRHKLYSIGEEQLIKIDLQKLPLTVGKLPGIADFLLRRDGVSRLHVKFFQKDGGEEVCMKDLNSTNGTYRNGTRLQTGETVSLRKGDEIRIGDVEFEFV